MSEPFVGMPDPDADGVDGPDGAQEYPIEHGIQPKPDLPASEGAGQSLPQVDNWHPTVDGERANPARSGAYRAVDLSSSPDLIDYGSERPDDIRTQQGMQSTLRARPGSRSSWACRS